MGMNKSELVAKAVEMELGTGEDLEQLTKADLVELIGEENLGDNQPPAELSAADKAKAERIAAREKPAPIQRKHAGMTVVEDLIHANLIPVAKKPKDDE